MRSGGQPPSGVIALPVADGGAALDSEGGGRAGAPAPELLPLLVMLDAVTPFGMVELERLLASLLKGPAQTAAERRVAELSALAQLLESELAVSIPLHPLAPVQVPQVDYDRTRPPGAPEAETLVQLYGGASKDGWSWACRAAWGLLPDGRKTKPGLGWPSTQRGQDRQPRSDRDLVVQSIRECAFALLRRPSSNVYIEWLDAQRRRAKAEAGGGQASEPKRLASIAAVYQQFPRGWPTALAAADITDAELEQARARLLAGAAARERGEAPGQPTAADRLAGLSATQLAELGLDERTRERLMRKGFGDLPLSQAAELAHALDGSLEWLAGERDAGPGAPAGANATFSPEALRETAKRAGVKLEALRGKAKLDVSGWRAVTSGKRDPTLRQAGIWATALRVGVAALLDERPPSESSP